MMTDKEFVEKLKKSSFFEHTGAQKEILWARLTAYLKNGEKVAGFWHFGFRFAHLVVVVLIVLLTSAGATFASQESLPGQPLYSVKRLSEDVNVFIIFDQKAKNEAKIKLTTKRLKEVNELVSVNPEKAEEVLAEYESQMENYKAEFSEDPELAESFSMTISINQEVLNSAAEQAPEELKVKIQALIQEEEPGGEESNESKVEEEQDTSSGVEAEETKDPIDVGPTE